MPDGRFRNPRRRHATPPVGRMLTALPMPTRPDPSAGGRPGQGRPATPVAQVGETAADRFQRRPDPHTAASPAQRQASSRSDPWVAQPPWSAGPAHVVEIRVVKHPVGRIVIIGCPRRSTNGPPANARPAYPHGWNRPPTSAVRNTAPVHLHCPRVPRQDGHRPTPGGHRAGPWSGQHPQPGPALRKHSRAPGQSGRSEHRPPPAMRPPRNVARFPACPTQSAAHTTSQHEPLAPAPAHRLITLAITPATDSCSPVVSGVVDGFPTRSGSTGMSMLVTPRCANARHRVHEAAASRPGRLSPPWAPIDDGGGVTVSPTQARAFSQAVGPVVHEVGRIQLVLVEVIHCICLSKPS